VGDVVGKLFRGNPDGVPEADLSDANTSYYYDQTAGTWVCKEAGKETAVVATPPPPPPTMTGPPPGVPPRSSQGITGRYVDTFSSQ